MISAYLKNELALKNPQVKHKKIDIAILDSYIEWQNVQNVEQILNLAAMIQKN